ncbi:MAG: NPCBM/NEW2 domain-containing protein [Oscillospiraceae bacterium]|nr:NPCBM/NEW2 domain-containing protein [Oscillospiraceae bacterium]
MNKRFQGLLAGILVGILLTSGVAFAKEATETLKVVYNNIKIIIDGKEYHPTDVNGKTVEPFIYQGTTYLPVRAVANAFDKDVAWDAQTCTVLLGKKNYDWLDQMGYADYETTGAKNTFSALPAGSEMTDGIKYDRGIYFYLENYYGREGTRENNDGSLENFQSVSYLLNGKYESFVGTLATLYDYYSQSGRAQIKFYGDGKLLYSSPIISEGTKSTPFDVSVSGIKLLEISVEYVNPDKGSSGVIRPVIADARFSK